MAEAFLCVCPILLCRLCDSHMLVVSRVVPCVAQASLAASQEALAAERCALAASQATLEAVRRDMAAAEAAAEEVTERLNSDIAKLEVPCTPCTHTHSLLCSSPPPHHCAETSSAAMRAPLYPPLCQRVEQRTTGKHAHAMCIPPPKRKRFH